MLRWAKNKKHTNTFKQENKCVVGTHLKWLVEILQSILNARFCRELRKITWFTSYLGLGRILSNYIHKQSTAKVPGGYDLLCYISFNIIRHIAMWKVVIIERLCAMKHYTVLIWTLLLAGFKFWTSWSEVRSSNRTDTRCFYQGSGHTTWMPIKNSFCILQPTVCLSFCRKQEIHTSQIYLAVK